MSDSRTPIEAPAHNSGISGSGPRQPANDLRKMTYRVGWKSGTIHRQRKSQAALNGGVLSGFAVRPSPSPLAAPHIPVVPRKHPAGRLLKLLLHPAPLPPARAWGYLLAVVPLVAFAGLVWLTYRLSL